MANEQTSEQIERQFAALKFKLKNLKEDTKSYFALENKIKKTKKLLEERKQFEFLAK